MYQIARVVTNAKNNDNLMKITEIMMQLKDMFVSWLILDNLWYFRRYME